MAKQVSFVNREKELAQIDTLIREWDTRRVLCIQATGGIGKTRLLQEVHQRHAESSDREAPLLVTNIIDFDDRTYHISQNVGRRIAQMLDEKVFEPYLRGLADYRKMEMAGISRERVTQEGMAVNQAFVDCFNKVTAKRRVVLLLDTTDALTGRDAWDYMLGLGLQLKNAVLLVAGRNAEVVREALQPELGEDVQLIVLPPLEEEASESYLRKKQDLLHITLDPELAQKLLLLAGGRPILIDLAVEWRARDIPLDWLVKSKLKELESLSKDALEKRQQGFEYQLVHHIADTRRPIDWLTLVMSRVYPLDVEMTTELLKMSEDEAETLFEEAQAYVFVKPLPDGRISLHDEMRRMINVHVWPEVDPGGDQQRRDSSLAVGYLKHRVQALNERIDHLEEEEKAAHKTQDVKAELSVFLEREALERELWVLEGRRLHHLLLVDLDKGVQAFAELSDKATQAYRFSLRETLVTQMQQFAQQLSPEQRQEVNIRRTRHLIDDGEYSEAKELLLEMLGREEISPDRHVEMLILLGNVEVRLGHFEQSIEYFGEAVKLSEKNNLEEPLVRAENALGWAYRLVGNWEEAAEQYRCALRDSLGYEDRHQQALILNNLGFALGLQPTEEEEAALPLCRQALGFWQEIGYERGVGQAFCTIGEILRFHNRLKEAREYFDKAAAIFEPANDLEWLSAVYCGRGIVQFLLSVLEEGDLERRKAHLRKAQIDLKKARGIGLRKDEPRYLHYLAHVALEQDDVQEATRLFKQSYDASQKTHDLYFLINSLGDLANIAAREHELHRRPEFEERLEEFEEGLERYRTKEGPDPLSRDVGLLIGYLGDLALSGDDLNSAIRYYKDGFVRLAGSGGYGPYTLVGHLERKERRWKEWVSEGRVSVDSIRKIGEQLEQFWRAEELDVTHVQVLLFFARWKKWGKEAK